MNRSLAALTLALLVGFGSPAHSSSSDEITETYPVDCKAILHSINSYHNDWIEADKVLEEKWDMLSPELIEQGFEKISYSIKMALDLSNLYAAFCK